MYESEVCICPCVERTNYDQTGGSDDVIDGLVAYRVTVLVACHVLNASLRTGLLYACCRFFLEKSWLGSIVPYTDVSQFYIPIFLQIKHQNGAPQGGVQHPEVCAR